MARLLLIRHGATAWNKETPGPYKVRAWADLPLHQTGIDEAKRLAQLLQRVPIDRLVSSDLQRASTTANIIGQSHSPALSPILTPDLRPWHMCALTGQDITPQIVSLMKDLSTNKPDVPIPGGESFNDFSRRVIPQLEGLMHAAQNSNHDIGVVTHTRDIRLLEAWLKAGGQGLKIDQNTMNREKEIAPGGLAEVAFTKSGEPKFSENPNIGGATRQSTRQEG